MCRNDIITHLWRERRRNSRKAIKSKIYGQIMQVAMQFMCGLLSTSHPSIPTTSTYVPATSTISSPTCLGCNKTTNCCVLERVWKCTESFNYILAFIHCSPVLCYIWSGLVCRLCSGGVCAAYVNKLHSLQCLLPQSNVCCYPFPYSCAQSDLHVTIHSPHDTHPLAPQRKRRWASKCG